MNIQKLQEVKFATTLANLCPVKAAFIISFGGGFSNNEIERRCKVLMAGDVYNQVMSNQPTKI